MWCSRLVLMLLSSIPSASSGIPNYMVPCRAACHLHLQMYQTTWYLAEQPAICIFRRTKPHGTLQSSLPSAYSGIPNHMVPCRAACHLHLQAYQTTWYLAEQPAICIFRCTKPHGTLQSSLPTASSGIPNHMVPCNMLGSHSSVTEYSSHVGCDTVSLGVWLHSARDQ
jgi:hypothetical protein